MARQEGEPLDGRNLMLYINTSEDPDSPSWKAQALATSHTITYNTETKERLTKDSPGGNPEKRITSVTVTIKADALRSFGDSDKKLLLKTMKQKKNVMLKYGFAEADEQAGDDLAYHLRSLALTRHQSEEFRAQDYDRQISKQRIHGLSSFNFSHFPATAGAPALP